MFFKKHRNLFGGLTAVFATLLAIILGCSMLAINQVSAQVDKFLNIDTSSTWEGGEITSDDVYYKSDFGDITALYKNSSDRTDAEQTELDNAQKKLLDAEVEYAAREAEEGDVLLKNGDVTENGESVPALPLKKNSNVTLFGYFSANPVYRSYSGGSKSYQESALVITLKDALGANGFNVNPTLTSALEKATSTHAVNSTNGTAVVGELNTSFYSSYESTYSDYSDAAIVVFAREGGEGDDLNTKDSEGISQLALHDNEAALLEMIKNSGKFSRTIVLINSGFPMELGWLDESKYGVDACLWIGEPGTYGFGGVAKILAGEANPSGRLVDTYAANSLSSPAVQNFGSMSDSASNTYIVEAEDIYTGYKYYETRYEDSILNASSSNAAAATANTNETADGTATWSYANEVVFPFGYGLSYTTFSQEIKGVTYNADSDSYTVTVTVTNTGDVAGKCSVAVYAQVPYDKDVAETESIRLVGFNKTLGTLSDGETQESADYDVTDLEAGTLKPGASEDVEVEVDRYLLSVYNEDARSGKGGYVLPKGDYYFAVGDDIHAALNNIIAVKDSTVASRLVEANGNAYTADPDQVYKVTGADGTVGSSFDLGAEYDETTYAASPYTGEDVSNVLSEMDVNHWIDNAVTYLSREDWKGTFPSEVSITFTSAMTARENEDYETPSDAPKKGTYSQGVDSGIDFLSMKDVPFTGTYTDKDGNEQDADAMWDKFLDQLSVGDLINNTLDYAEAVTSVNSPKVLREDGPDGISATLACGTSSTCYNSEIVLSSAFNPKLLQLRGSFMAEDCLYSKYSVIWGPGADIHRTPFSGRNYEYYSECGYMSYICGSYEVPAMSEKGVISCIKHFVGNDQETNRQKVATFNTEQGWRQTMLKGFEGAIGKGKSMGVMTSYNRIGLTVAAACKETNVTIMQGEWGFTGFNETDAFMGNITDYKSVPCIMNGTCVFCMEGGPRQNDLTKLQSRDSTDAILQALRNVNKQVYWSLLRSNVVNGIPEGATVVSTTSWWKTALVAINIVIGILAAACAALYVTGDVFTVIGKKDEGGEE